MKRSEVEAKVLEFGREIGGRIESAPLKSFFAGIVVGGLLVIFRGLFIPLIAFGAAGAFVFWLLSDKDDAANSPTKFGFTSTDGPAASPNKEEPESKVIPPAADSGRDVPPASRDRMN